MAHLSVCAVPGCGKSLRARGYCNSHYIRWRVYGDPLRGDPARGVTIEWIRTNADHQGDDCLIWPFSRNNRGYGRLNHGGFHLAHRAMTALAHGDPPTPEHDAAHSCGNGHMGCCNPRHLRWATASSNEADKIGHGTSNRGHRNGRSVLAEEEVLRVVEMRRLGAKYKEVSAETGLPFSTVASICQGKNWSHLTAITPRSGAALRSIRRHT